jgi:hypothetical protein
MQRLRSSASLFVLASVCVLGAVVVGCGGSGNPTFQAGAPDAGAPGTTMDGSLLPQDSGGTIFNDAVAASCAPASVSAYAPSWKPPQSFKSGACTNLQISSYFDACLGTAATPGGCSAYESANASCASCLATDDTAAKLGPIIWHSNRSYYTTNIAGCIADEQGDAGTSSCAAAYQANVGCNEAACAACITSGYSYCEGQAGGGECKTYVQAKTAACGAVNASGTPTAVCFPPSTDSTEDAYLQLAPIFCGQ